MAPRVKWASRADVKFIEFLSIICKKLFVPDACWKGY
jgi:hypothetical protein